MHMFIRPFFPLHTFDPPHTPPTPRLQRELPGSHDYHTALLGKMRCLASLAQWEQLGLLCRVDWRKSEPHMR